MAKVDWITWKTDPKEIINPNEVNKEMDNYFREYNIQMNSIVYEEIKQEINKGGLSREALSISGISPQYEIAQDILNKIDEIKYTYEKLQRHTLKTLQEQKEEEKNQLIEEISKSIDKENKSLESIRNNPNNAEIVELTTERIEKLKERLELAKAL